MQFVATSSAIDDVKLVARYIRKYGSDFHKHLDIGKRDAVAMKKLLDKEYHTSNKPIMSDEEYDILSDWIEETYPTVKKTVGAKVKTRNKKVRLEVPMASQNKLKPGQDLSKFLVASMYVISDKLDGISLEITYDNGVPIAAHTRGDGLVGQDVSGVIPALNIPHEISLKSRFLVRAEFLIKKKTFSAKYSKREADGEFATARNMGGGLLTRGVASKAVSHFDVVCYEIVKGKGAGTHLSLQLTLLKKYGFNVVRHRLVPKLNEAKLIELHNEFKKRSPYEIDGIIVTQDVAYRVTAENPKHSRAFKINSLESSMVVPVKSVEWNDSRHNRAIPRIEIDPIILGGVEVTWFTGHNYFYVQHGYTIQEARKAKKAGITLPVRPINTGAMIRVIRSGDVIPYIMEVVKPAKTLAKPAGRYTVTEDGVHAIYRKTSTDSKKKRIVHFFNALEVEGLKGGTVERLYDAGYDTVRKIIRLKVDDLLQLEGFKETSANKLVENIKKSLRTNATFATLGYASHVFGDKIGTSKLEDVIKHIPNIMALATKLTPTVLASRIARIPGIANTAKDIAENLPKFVEFVERTKIKIVAAEVQETVSNKLSGIKVLLTGVRDPQFVKDVVANGGAEGSLKAANYVITKMGNSNNKTEYAEQNNIPVMTIEQFRKRFKI